jgi:hypothetical protein
LRWRHGLLDRHGIDCRGGRLGRARARAIEVARPTLGSAHRWQRRTRRWPVVRGSSYPGDLLQSFRCNFSSHRRALRFDARGLCIRRRGCRLLFLSRGRRDRHSLGSTLLRCCRGFDGRPRVITRSAHDSGCGTPRNEHTHDD